MPGGMRARVVDEALGRSRAHDAAGLGVEGQLSDRRQPVDKRRRHTRHPVRHAAGLRLGSGSRKSNGEQLAVEMGGKRGYDVNPLSYFGTKFFIWQVVENVENAWIM